MRRLSTTIAIRFSREDFDRLKAIAAAERCPLSSIVRHLLRKGLDAYEADPHREARVQHKAECAALGYADDDLEAFYAR